MQVILFIVKPDANAGSDTTATTCTLVCGGLCDGFDMQLLDLVPVAVTFDAGKSGIDDKADARNGQRRFSDVGRQND